MRTIFTREALDLLRDRRALLFLFAPPLLMPLIGAVGGAFVLWQIARQTSAGIPVAVVNGEQLPGLVTKLEDNRLLQLVDAPPDQGKALQSGELTAVLEVPPDATERLAAEETITLTLTSSRSGWLPDFAVVSIQETLSEYAGEVLTERLARHELNQGWAHPIRLERESAAPTGVAAAPVVAGDAVPSSLGGIFLPLAIASWAFSGGLSLMAHMTVGEKERHTMESLLITPASRIGIVLGKIALSIIVSAITIGLWSLDSLAYVFLLSILPSGSAGFATPITAQLGNLGPALVWLVLLMLPLMTMANGLVAAACTFAKNYRESNLFLGLLQLLLPGLALLATFGVGATPPLVVYALPVVGVLVAMRDLFGGGVAPWALMLAWTTAATYAVAAILLAAYVFSREWALMRGV
ncbi:MAG: ABC transporter permease [Chloroflexota bacterium]|nr:ABC transporter permease [Chloroflexota bacterium]